MRIKTKYIDEPNCRIVTNRYMDGSLCLDLVSGHETIARITTCIEGCPVKQNRCIVKNWSENEGILEALVEAGVLRDMGIRIPTGFVEAHVCEYLL